MAGYADTRQMIIDTLMGRMAGTEIQPEDHQAFALQITEYIRSVELVAGNATPIGFADANTVPVQPDNGQAVYLSSVSGAQTVTFSNFIGQNGNPISVTSTANVIKLVTLLWNGQYWSSQVTSVNAVRDTTYGYLFMGIATPTTNPGTPDQKVFYIAGFGTYTNFDGISVGYGKIATLFNTASGWAKNEIDIPTKKKAYFAAGEPPVFSNIVVSSGNTTITIKFPSVEFRIYDDGGNVIVNTTSYYGSTFTVSSFNRLVYDLGDNSIKIVALNNTGKYIDLFAVGGESFVGLLVPYYINSTLKNIPSNTEKTNTLILRERAIFYLVHPNRPIYLEENTTTGAVYVKYSGTLNIRGITSKGYTMAQLASELNTTLVVSTKGVSGCIEIPNVNNLVFDTNTLTMKIKYRDDLTINDIPLILTSSGAVIYVEQGLLNAFDSRKIGALDISLYYDKYKVIFENLYKDCDASFLFFSDIHGQQTNFRRIVSMANSLGTSKVNAIINGGDTVTQVVGDGLAWYNDIVNDCNVDVLNCCGNHDVWSAVWQLAPKTTVYNTVIAPMITKVQNIVQPTGAAVNGYCYYYKDYDNIRIIVLCAMYISSGSPMFWDSAQASWLENVLADAKTNNKAVICVNHSPFNVDSAELIESKWTSFKAIDWKNDISHTTYDEIHLSPEVVNKVYDFINSGGKFVCWLTGHVHIDMLLKNTAKQQFMVNIASAKNTNHTDGYITNNENDYLYDCFDYIGFDTTRNFIKVYRIGWNMDASLRVRNILNYNYASNTIITEN